jgi:DNA-directed RNA polymerase subunit RPC12/RpoP
MAVERLYVFCDTCKKPIYSGLTENPSISLRDNDVKCPHCGNWIRSSKAEMWSESVAREKFPDLD